MCTYTINENATNSFKLCLYVHYTDSIRIKNYKMYYYQEYYWKTNSATH